MVTEHDAFISYSHAADGKLAPAVQSGLEKLAKPWLKLRAVNVFRDETSLAANPRLWDGIVAHLSRSRWFLLMASPQSAASAWCNKEVQWWLDNKGLDQMLILLTEGDIVWDRGNDFDWTRTTALSRTLSGRIADEPLYVDLRWARGETKLTLHNPRFRQAVLDVAAPIRNIPKDELDGEDVRQLRRSKRIAQGATAAITLLFVAAVGAGLYAERQRAQAVRERNIAQARQFAAQAELARGQSAQDLEISARLAVASVERAETAEGMRALSRALALMPPLPTVLTTLPAPEGTRQVALSSDGSALLVVAAQQFTVWTEHGVVRAGLPACTECGEVTAVAAASNGQRVALARGGVVDVLQKTETGYGPFAQCTFPHDASITMLTTDPTGTIVVAIASQDPKGVGEFWKLSEGACSMLDTAKVAIEMDEVDAMQFSDDSRFLGVAGMLRDRSGRMEVTVKLVQIFDGPSDMDVRTSRPSVEMSKYVLRSSLSNKPPCLAISRDRDGPIVALANGRSIHLYRSTFSAGFEEVARLSGDAAAMALTNAKLAIAEVADDKRSVRVVAAAPSGVREDTLFGFPPVRPVALTVDGRGEAVFFVWKDREPELRLHRRPTAEPVTKTVQALRDVAPALSQGARFLAVAAQPSGPHNRLIEVWDLDKMRVSWKTTLPFKPDQPAFLAVSSNGDAVAVAQADRIDQATRSTNFTSQTIHVPGEIKGIKFLQLTGLSEFPVACTASTAKDGQTKMEYWSTHGEGEPNRIHTALIRSGTPCVFGGHGTSLAIGRGNILEVINLAENTVVLDVPHESEIMALDAWGKPLRIVSFSGQQKGFCTGSACGFRGRVITHSAQKLLAAASARGIRPYEPDRPAP